MELDSDPKYIYAPYDGMVETDDNISEDQQIGPNMELVRIYDLKCGFSRICGRSKQVMV